MVAILADYDKRNNDSIVNGADWKGPDGGTPLTRDRYVDALQARYYKNKGTKMPKAKPETTTLIDVLGWSLEGDRQTLIATTDFVGRPDVSVYVKQGQGAWRQWASVSLPTAAVLPKPAAADQQTVSTADLKRVAAINNYRAKGVRPKDQSFGKGYAKYFPVLRNGEAPGFSTSRSCKASVDEGVTSAWQVPTASGTLTLVANRCDEKAATTRAGYWLTWSWSDDKTFGIAGKKLRSYACQLSGPTVELDQNGKRTWYGPGYYRLSTCDMKRL